MIGAVAYVGINIPDMDKAIIFPQDVLGLRAIADYTIEQ